MTAPRDSGAGIRRWAIRLPIALVASLVAAELALQVLGLVTRMGYERSPEPPRRGSYRVLCLGDSNTYGLYLRASEAWPALLQQLSDEKLGDGEVQVINLGFPGSPSSRLAENIREMLRAFEPDLVIVLTGVNDYIYGAFDGTGVQPAFGRRLRAWVTRNVRLYRLLVMNSTRSDEGPPRVENPADRVFREEIEGLRALGMRDAEEALASLYKQLGVSTVRDEDGTLWIAHDGKRASLAALAASLQYASTYEVTTSVLSYVEKVGLEMMELRVPGTARYDGAHFDLEAVPVLDQSEETPRIMARNLAHVRDAVEESGARLVLLTYLSGKHFYGRVNQHLRAIATELALPVVDLERAGAAACPDGAPCEHLYFPDRHPTAAGHAVMADTLWRSPLVGGAIAGAQ